MKRPREEETHSDWCNIPQSFLSSLLYYLSPKSRCALKATCKSWNEAKLLLPVPVGSPSSPYHSAPLLMLKQTELSTQEFRHPMSDESFKVSFDHHHLKLAVVRYSNFGWLLISHIWALSGKRCPFFYNPFTKEKIELPLVGMTGDIICFTSPPTSLDCQVFWLSIKDGKTAHLILSENIWRINDFSVMQLPLESNTHVFHGATELRSLHSPVFCRGSLYSLSYSGRVCVYSNRAFTVHDTGLFSQEIMVKQSFLIEVDEKLLGIFKTDEEIVVRWLDVEKWEWHPIQPNDLLDKILYLVKTRSFVQCDATTKGKGNMICFYDHIRSLPIYYSLDTKKYHSMDSTCISYEVEIPYRWSDNTPWICPTVSDTS